MLNNKKEILSFIRKYSQQEGVPKIDEVDPKTKENIEDVPNVSTDSISSSTPATTIQLENTEIDLNKPDPNTIPPEKIPVAKQAPRQVANNNTDIKQMQLWIQKFADTVIGKGDVLAKHFNDYVTEKYVATAPKTGKEYSINPEIKDVKEKQKFQTDPTEQSNVFDSVHRLGNLKKESVADGVWGPRTNNSLLNVYAIAYSLYNLHNKLGEKETFGFEQSDLKTFDDNLIKSEEELKKTSIIEKQKKAKLISPVIKKLIDFYKGFSKVVLDSPVYSKYIEGESMYTIKPSKTDPAQKTPQEEKALQNADKMFIGPLNLTSKAGRQQTIQQISLRNLMSEQDMSKIGLSLGYTENELSVNPDIKKKILNEIMEHVNNVLKLNTHFDKTQKQAPVGSK